MITCHDLTPLRYPNSFKAWVKYRYWQPRHLSCASRVVAISRHVADHLISVGFASDRVVVIPNGIDVLRSTVPAPGTEDLLAIARHDSNKNLKGLLKYLAFAQRNLPEWRGVLRIVGHGLIDSSELQALRRELPRPDGLLFISDLSRPSLLAMIRNSLALVSSSLDEDLTTRSSRQKLRVFLLLLVRYLYIPNFMPKVLSSSQFVVERNFLFTVSISY